MGISTIRPISAITAGKMETCWNTVGCKIMRKVAGRAIETGTFGEKLLANGDLGRIVQKMTRGSSATFT
jgi:hypothetical protein